jgi:hypothetical protein
MAVQVEQVYQDVCNAILEPTGVTTLGIMDLNDFFNILNDVLQDFLLRSGCVTGFFSLTSTSGTAAYAEPNTAMEVHSVYYNNVFLSRSSTWYLDNYSQTWPSLTASQSIPERWIEDDQPPKTIVIEPVPTVSGVTITLVATAQPSTYPSSMATYMTFIPDTATSYVKYGVLAKIFSGDTEYKDDQRGKYCQDKYLEGLNYFQYLVTEVGMEPRGQRGR